MRSIGAMMIWLWMGLAAVRADDVGMVKSRLIQLNDTTYLLETDVSQRFVWAITKPVFPNAFTVSELSYINQRGWVTVQVTATGATLKRTDEIMLPWARNGVTLIAQWTNGELAKAVFTRELDGIHVRMDKLLPLKISKLDVFQISFQRGTRYMAFLGIQLLLLLSLVLWTKRKSYLAIAWAGLGMGVALVLLELGLNGPDLLFTSVCFLVATVVFLLANRNGRPESQANPVMLLLGLLLGLSVAHEQLGLDFKFEQRLQSNFAFSLAVVVVQLAVISLLVLLVNWLKQKKRSMVVLYIAGSGAVFLTLLLCVDFLMADRTDVLRLQNDPLSSTYSLPVSATTGTNAQKGAQELTTPIMHYLSVESFEVREEILVNARTAVRLMGINDEGMNSIPIESQEEIKARLLELFETANPITIDGLKIQPDLQRVDFVTLSAAGVLIREAPVTESLNRGIIGLTYVYPTKEMASELQMEWTLLDPALNEIESSVSDPFGSTVSILTEKESTVSWKRKLTGYKVPTIESILFTPPRLPLLSVGLFVLVIIGYWLLRNSPKRRVLIILALTVSFVCYPYVRTATALPLWLWKPNVELTGSIADALLTNVYRSFEVRNESEVYDRLRTSVTGEQLTEVYLQNRQSLELENRGGAKAYVDEVEVLAVNDVQADDQQRFKTDIEWVVGGSVNHFGHTHYRKNRYHALITLVVEEGNWKIVQIEPLEEERLL